MCSCLRPAKKPKVASQPCFKDRFIPRHRIQWGLPMERPLPQIAGAWRPLGDGRGRGRPLPLGPPTSGEPGPPLGKDRPGRRLRAQDSRDAIKAAELSGNKRMRKASPVDPSRSFWLERPRKGASGFFFVFFAMVDTKSLQNTVRRHHCNE